MLRAGAVASALSVVDDMLALSPMLVGGVEEDDDDWGSEEASTVILLMIDPTGDARVMSGRLTALGVAAFFL